MQEMEKKRNELEQERRFLDHQTSLRKLAKVKLGIRRQTKNVINHA